MTLNTGQVLHENLQTLVVQWEPWSSFEDDLNFVSPV